MHTGSSGERFELLWKTNDCLRKTCAPFRVFRVQVWTVVVTTHQQVIALRCKLVKHARTRCFEVRLPWQRAFSEGFTHTNLTYIYRWSIIVIMTRPTGTCLSSCFSFSLSVFISRVCRRDSQLHSPLRVLAVPAGPLPVPVTMSLPALSALSVAIPV